MKYIIIVGDGMCDYPVEALGDRTPLEAAKTPHLDGLAKRGEAGMMVTMFPGLPVGSVVGIMGILGYDPPRFYPHGRASLEAIGQGIRVGPSDIAFRCNLITVIDEVIRDFTAGQIPDDVAKALVRALDLSDFPFHAELHPGQSYRNLLVARNAVCDAGDLEAFEPHENIGKRIGGLLLRGHSRPAMELAAQLNDFMLDSLGQIRRIARRQGLETNASMVWLWSPARNALWPPFEELCGLTGAIVGGLDFLIGIGMAADLEVTKVPGATGYLDSKLENKFGVAKEFIEARDLVLIHVNAPDEEGHMRNPDTKIEAIERIDEAIVGPLIEFLASRYPDDYRIAVTPDHYTLVSTGRHTEEAVPFIMAGAGIAADSVGRFSETEIIGKTRGHIMSYDLVSTLIEKGEQEG